MKFRPRADRFELIRRYKKYCRRLRKTGDMAERYASPRLTARKAFLQSRIEKLAALLNPLKSPRIAASLAAAGMAIVGGGLVPQLAAQTPKITALSPATNATQVAAAANVNITFSTTMSVATLTAAHINIFGSQTGYLSESGVFSGNPLRSFNPDSDFHPGELLSVTVTGATSSGGDPLGQALVYQFTVDVNVGTGEFNTSAFGSGVSTRVAVGDLDGDGDLDAVVANYGQPQDIWLNNGDGAFSVSTFGSGNSQDVALGDLDNDGDLDAIVGNYNQSQEIWTNNGDGTFSSSSFGGGATMDVNMADLDGDGDLDVVLTSNTGSANEVWLNCGDFVFSSRTFGTGNSRQSVIGDLDNDGDLDVVIANQNQTAEIWTNNGDGTFSAATSGVSGNSRGAAIGDLDGDGNLDIIVATYGAEQIWMGNGDGSFATSTFGGGQSAGVALGDLDGDGDLDAILSNTGSEAEDIWFNNGDGTFVSSALGANGSLGVALGDLDGDGDLDAIIANVGQAQNIWLNNGPVATPPRISSFSPATNAIAVPVDTDIDITFSTTMSVATLTASNIRIFGAQTGFISESGVFSGNPLRSFNPDSDFHPGERIYVTVTGASNAGGDPITSALVYSFTADVNAGTGVFNTSAFGSGVSTRVAVGDLDGDGDLDAVVANYGQPQDIWLNNGDGAFSVSTFGSGNSQDVALGDLDNDGDLDAIVGNYNQPQEIWTNNGDGTFSSSSFGSGATMDVNMADLDGDGDLDVVLMSNTGSANEVWLNCGDFVFSSRTFGTGNSRQSVIGDLDNDGDLDIVIINQASANHIWLNNGDGTFSAATFGSSGNMRGAAIGDIDGDGNLDVVIARYGGPWIWLGNGDGSFATSAFGSGPAQGVALGDIDGDGDLDAIVANGLTFAEDIWFNNGDGTFVSSSQGGSNSTGVALGDLDGDGDLDAIIANNGQAQNIWINTGGAAAPAAPRISSFSPATNAIAVPVDADIDITFSTTMSVATVTASNIRIFGAQTGFISESGAFSGNPIRNFDPTNNFKPGERVYVTVTGASNAGGDPITSALVYSFTAAAGGDVNFTFLTSTFGGRTSFDVEVGDLDGDGNLDAVFTESYGSQVWLGNGDGTFNSTSFGGGVKSGNGLGDLDGDGDLDVVQAGFNSHDIWLNNGDGTFSISSFGTSNGKDAVIGDLDGDGDLDVIVTVGAGGSGAPNQIWLNNGDATFTSTTFGTGNSSKVDLGDLDNDGDLDAIITNYDQGASIWLNNGDGTFTSAAFGTDRSQDVAIGDLDGDGNLDAVVAHYGRPQSIWIGQGDGTFNSSTFGSNQGEAVDLGDLDGDGDLDAIVAHTFGSAQKVWLNNGDGTFTSFGLGGGSSFGVAMGDIDNDGDLDAIIANALNQADEIWLNVSVPQITDRSPAPATTAAVRSDNIEVTFSEALDPTSATNSIFIVNGAQTGRLTTSAAFSTLNGGSKVVVDPAADFKAGERIHVTVTNAQSSAGVPISSASVWTFRAAADAGSAVFTTSSFGGRTSFDVEVGDLDGDGNLDAVFTESYGSQVWLGNGDGTFNSTSFGGGVKSGNGLGDLDGDGDLDVIQAGFNSHDIWLNNGDGTFSISSFGTGNGKDAAIGDLDGDGDLDVIVSIGAGGSGAPNQIWLNNGDGTFTSTAFGTGNSSKADLGDLDNDGDLDAIITNYDQGASIWLNNGDGTFTSTAFGTDRSQDVALGDLDGDGNLDAVTAHYGRPQSIWIGQGDGTFNSSSFGHNQGEAVDLGDLDGDGDLDAIVGHTFGSAQRIWLNNGDGTFASSSLGSGSSFGVAIGDVDNDGDLDAIIANALNQADDIWLNLQAPQLTDVTPTCIVASSAEQQVTLCGIDLAVTGATITTLNSSGASVGTASIGTSQLTPQKILATIPAGLTSTAGNLTLTLFTSAGATSANLTVYPGISISGAAGECSNEPVVYSAEPVVGGATIVWSVTGGTIQSGQGSHTVEVLWEAGNSGELTVERSYEVNCTTSASFSAGTVAFIAAAADLMTSTQGSVSTNVLTNDSGTGLNIVNLEMPANGSATHANGVVTYTPDGGYAGTDLFNYTIENDAGCRATAAIIVSVINSECLPINLEYVERQKNRSGDVRGLDGVESAVVSPDGKHVYAAGRSDHSIAIFTRDENSGALSYEGRVRNQRGGVKGLKYVSDIAVSPDGAQVYAVGYGDNSLAIFDRDSSTGLLSYVECKKRGTMDGGLQISGLKRPRALSVSPDGRSIYVTGYDDHSLAHFSVAAGSVAYEGVYKHGSGGVSRMRQPIGLDVSKDGAQVYVTSTRDDALVQFDRNTGDGALTFVAAYRDGIDGNDGLDKASDVSVSSDGKNVYVAGSGENKLATFDRNAVDGSLTFDDVMEDGVGGVEGLAAVRSVQSSNDACHVWTSSPVDNSVAVFERSLEDGDVTFIENAVDGLAGFDGLRGALMTALSPAGDHAYVAGAGEDALAVVFRNRRPQAEADVKGNVDASAVTTITVLNNDDDVDDHVLSIVSATDGTLGTTAISGGGTTIDYTAGAATGTDEFTYTVEDGHGGSSTATVTVNVAVTKSGASGAAAAHASAWDLQLTPNPGRERVQLNFKLEAAAAARVEITDMRGVRRTAQDLGTLAAGDQRFELLLREATGLQLEAGVYVVELFIRADGGTEDSVTQVLVVR